eukprot:scaffold190398_cov16-Tisochrysis_lutea.AAC.1
MVRTGTLQQQLPPCMLQQVKFLRPREVWKVHEKRSKQYHVSHFLSMLSCCQLCADEACRSCARNPHSFAMFARMRWLEAIDSWHD